MNSFYHLLYHALPPSLSLSPPTHTQRNYITYLLCSNPIPILILEPKLSHQIDRYIQQWNNFIIGYDNQTILTSLHRISFVLQIWWQKFREPIFILISTFLLPSYPSNFSLSVMMTNNYPCLTAHCVSGDKPM